MHDNPICNVNNMLNSPKHNHRNQFTVLFSPEWLGNLARPDVSPLRHLHGPNERHSSLKEGFMPGKPVCDFYPNLGIGQAQSAMIHFNSAKNSICEIKGYFSACEFWRHDAPFDTNSYVAGN